MCAKYHNRPLLTWFIRANIVTSHTVVSGQRPRLTLRFSVRCCIIYRWCYINEYCKGCLIATAMKFYTNNFIEYIYNEMQNYCWLLLITNLNLKMKSFTAYRVTLIYQLVLNPRVQSTDLRSLGRVYQSALRRPTESRLACWMPGDSIWLRVEWQSSPKHLSMSIYTPCKLPVILHNTTRYIRFDVNI